MIHRVAVVLASGLLIGAVQGDGCQDPIWGWRGDPLVTVRLTHNDYRDLGPWINEAGQVLWLGMPDDGDVELFLYDGIRVRRLTNNSVRDLYPSINDLGEVVWSHEVENLEVFLWDGDATTQLTSDEGSSFLLDDVAAKINNRGQIVWRQFDAIRLYDGTRVSTIATQMYGSSSTLLNDAGELAWVRDINEDAEIYFYNPAGTIIQVTDDETEDHTLTMNAAGQLAWLHGRKGRECAVFFWGGGEVLALTDSDARRSALSMNDRGELAWVEYDPGTDSSSIHVLDEHGERTVVHGLERFRGYSGIRNDDRLMWQQITSPTSSELFGHANGVTRQLTSSGTNKWGARMNDAGEITWYESDPEGSEFEIVLALRATVASRRLTALVDASIEDGSLEPAGWPATAQSLSRLSRAAHRLELAIHRGGAAACVWIRRLEHLEAEVSGDPSELLRATAKGLSDAYQCASDAPRGW